MNGELNLVLLCPEHHEVIDQNEATYTVERLVGIKQVHEDWVSSQLSREESGTEEGPLVTETLHSSVLNVDRIPQRIYCAPTEMGEEAIKALLLQRPQEAIVLPFMVKAATLFTFTDLTVANNPFAAAVRPGTSADFVQAPTWWNDKDKSNWYVTLLNRTLHKLTGRKGLRFDGVHKRYYFEPHRDEAGKALELALKYTALNQESERKVVWQPKRESTGEVRGHWVHLALNMRFLRVTEGGWILALRPEHRFTKDGFELMPSGTIGPRSTRMKSHLYNYQVLAELQFWREFLSEKQPRIILDFGGQSMVIDAQLVQAEVEWLGVPEDRKSFDNAPAREDDLFTSAAYAQTLRSSHADAELEDWEAEELETLVDEQEPTDVSEDGE